MTDRSINRILSLPIFDDEFNRALRLVHLDHVEFWLAVIDDRSTAVDSKIATLVSAGKEDQEAKDLLMRRLDLLTMLAHLIGGVLDPGSKARLPLIWGSECL